MVSEERGAVSIVRRFLKRYWSLLAALSIPLLDGYADRIPDPIDYQSASKSVLALCFIYGIGAIICLGLLVHSWMVQRRYTKNKWWLIFWAHILLLPALVSIGLGLHRVQTFTYELAVDFQYWGAGRWYQNLHFYVDGVAERLFWLMLLDLAMVIAWGIVAVSKNKSSRPISKPA
jgi:hypothetical protein